MRKLLLILISLLAFVLPASADLTMTGFNDFSGINSNPITDDPYSLGLVTGQGAGEPGGWTTTWSDNPTLAEVVSSPVFEGDQALMIPATTAPFRAFTDNLIDDSHIATIETYVRFDPGARLIAYTEVQSTGESVLFQGPVWSALPDGSFNVLDGDGTGGGANLSTGFLWIPNIWYQVVVQVDVANREWDFYVDGNRFMPPNPLGFRGDPHYIDRIRYLSEGSGPVYIDAITINAPEPSSLVLGSFCILAFGAAGIRKRRKLMIDERSV